MMRLWRQQQQAQLEAEEEEEILQREQLEADRAEHRRLRRLEEISENTSRQLAQQFEAQMAAQTLQEQQDAAIAAALAATEYEQNRNHENQLRREAEAEELRQQEAQVQAQAQAEVEQPRQQPVVVRPQNWILPKGRRPYTEPSEQHYLGPMNVLCSHCNALHFESEKLSSSTRALKRFGGCCLQGQINLPPFHQPPRELADLLFGISPLSASLRTIFINIMLPLPSLQLVSILIIGSQIH